MFVAISDEAGDLGVTYKGGTRSFVISLALLQTREGLLRLNETARRFSRPYLKSPLRKWSELKGEAKRDPLSLYGFYRNLHQTLSNEFFVLSFFILDKRELESGILELDKRTFKVHIAEGYKKCFMRIFAFLKRYNYEKRLYPTLPSVEWFLDRNTEREREIKKAIVGLAENKGVELRGPFFVSKREHGSFGREVATSIKIVDLFAGVTRVAVEYYMNNNSSCDRQWCENCSHPYIQIWKLISEEMSVKDFSFWKWRGIIYYPPQSREFHERFFGKDPFLIYFNQPTKHVNQMSLNAFSFLDDRTQPKIRERDFDKMFDNGEDISDYLDLSRAVSAERFVEEADKSERESD